MGKIQNEFGSLIKELREERNLTQTELGESKCGLDRSAISRIESGDITPTIRVLFKLADGLEVEPETLVKRLKRRNPDYK